jgi:hypothetical protein
MLNNAVRSMRIRNTLLGAGWLLVAHSVPAMQAAGPTAGNAEYTGVKNPSVRNAVRNSVRNDIEVLVSVGERKLIVMAGKDTLHTAPIAVPSGEMLEYGGRRWQFTPPPGTRSVRAKRVDPVWTPPDWHYV